MSAPSALLVSPLLPSILGPHISAVGIADISLNQHACIPNVHVFPSHLNLDRLRDALVQLTRLYPVLCGRVRRRAVVQTAGRPFEYFIELTNSPFEITLLHAEDASLSYPFPDRNVTLQETTSPYVTPFAFNYFVDPSEPLFTVRVTRFSTYDVLGLNWAHIVGDGSACNAFTRLLSRLYEGGASLSEADWPDYGDHVKVEEEAPSEEVCRRWDSVVYHPPWKREETGKVWMDACEGTGLIQFKLNREEIKRLQSLASGPGPEGWVSEQDTMTSYFLNLTRMVGVPLDRVTNAVNYRSFNAGHAAFPSTLPRLVANISHMYTSPPLPTEACSTTSPLSLRPFATHLRASLTRLKTDAEYCLEWVSVGALRMRQAADLDLTQQYVPAVGELGINSNWRYHWNYSFGFEKGTTGFHTGGTVPRFLRVFESQSGEEAELSWRLEKAQAEQVMSWVEQDRKENWARWE